MSPASPRRLEKVFDGMMAFIYLPFNVCLDYGKGGSRMKKASMCLLMLVSIVIWTMPLMIVCLPMIIVMIAYLTLSEMQ